ncbi:hypothetical protein [Novosphingobium sp.]|uniref:hypothetical protein n=1 Tax=Novosphingobium sp. TaxID=1874826 RepID=UPI0035B3F81D
MDYVAAHDNPKLLAMCAAVSNAMHKNRTEACGWYPRGDNRTALRSMNVARYCS